IIKGLGQLAGTPKDTATDEKAYRQVAIDPIWNNLPLPLRTIGRSKLRWDSFLMEARGMVFSLSPEGRLTMRPDAASRLNAPAGPVIGIDLGTTYSVVAYLDAQGRPTTIPNAVGDLITPSVVLLDESGPVVGKEAVLASAMEPEKIAECAKRDMGSKFYRKKVNGEFLPPEVLSSVILRALKDDACRKLGDVRY